MKEEPLCFVKLLYYEADLTIGKKKKKANVLKCSKCPYFPKCKILKRSETE